RPRPRWSSSRRRGRGRALAVEGCLGHPVEPAADEELVGRIGAPKVDADRRAFERSLERERAVGAGGPGGVTALSLRARLQLQGALRLVDVRAIALVPAVGFEESSDELVEAETRVPLAVPLVHDVVDAGDRRLGAPAAPLRVSLVTLDDAHHDEGGTER